MQVQELSLCTPLLYHLLRLPTFSIGRNQAHLNTLQTGRPSLPLAAAGQAGQRNVLEKGRRRAHQGSCYSREAPLLAGQASILQTPVLSPPALPATATFAAAGADPNFAKVTVAGSARRPSPQPMKSPS